MSDKTLELQIRIAADEAARIVSSLKDQIKELAEESGKYAKKDGEALKESFKEAEDAAKDTKTGIEGIVKAVGSLTEVIIATKALSVIKDMGAFALTTADNFQTARNQFGVLLGDMEAGAGLFNQIKEFNDVTPFDLDTLTQATNVLISAKVPLVDLQDQLTKFGDLSQGNSQRMTSYINAFSQASAKGKADMQVLNTYLNQGVPILDALARNFGVTTAEIVEMSSKGQISFADFSKAIDDLTASGGQYFGGMELASKSLAAMQEGLTEATNTLAASFGDMLMPVAIAVVEALTNITNAINESPLLKGLLIGAIVAITGYLAAMAVKATIAFAAQMALNFAIGALNPVVLATTIAVAGLAAGYTIYAANQQNAARETENAALQQYKQTDAVNSTANAVAAFTEELRNMTDVNINNSIVLMNNEIRELENIIRTLNQQVAESFRDGDDARGLLFLELVARERRNLDQLRLQLEAAFYVQSDRRTSWIDSMYGNSPLAKIERVNEQLRKANEYLSGEDLSDYDRNRLREIVRGLREELDRLTNTGPDINKLVADWKNAWSEIWDQFQADQKNDLFYSIDLEHSKKLKEMRDNYVLENQEIIDQVNEYYAAQRREVIKQLEYEEARILRDISKSKVDALHHELQEALKAINTLEAQRVIAAAGSEAEIAAIRERFAGMRADTTFRFQIEIDKAKLDEAREAVKNWQEELSDNLLLALMNLNIFSNSASVILSDLTMQLTELSTSATLSGFEEFGRALGQGEDAAESMSRALAQMANQILKQLPMMFLQAGLQLIANGQWPLGLGFVAAAGSSAIISGYVEGASKHAQGGIFNEYGQVAKAYAAGGAFTNQIVSTPTYFRYGGGFEKGLMGEAGPEAIVPLTRMPNGDLGVRSSGSGTNVIVKIINYSGADVSQRETESADGGREIEVTIGNAINKHLASGKADSVMQSRFGQRAVGV